MSINEVSQYTKTLYNDNNLTKNVIMKRMTPILLLIS